MPELPDVVVFLEYLECLECLECLVLGVTLERVRLGSPFVLRSVDPALSETHGRRITGLRRLGLAAFDFADGSLLRADRPRTLEELEARSRPPREPAS